MSQRQNIPEITLYTRCGSNSTAVFLVSYTAQIGKMQTSQIIHTLESKAQEFVRSNPQFQQVARDVFDEADVYRRGKLTIDQAAPCVDIIFEKLQEALKEYGGNLAHALA